MFEELLDALRDLERHYGRRDFLRLVAAGGAALPFAVRLRRLPMVSAAPAIRKNVADVIRFSTRPQGWKGRFGFVTFRIHPVFFDDQRAYHIRTDASDAAFARRVGLVHVPKLSGALKAKVTADYFAFTNGRAGQLPVVSTVPGQPDYTPAFQIRRVTFTGTPRLLSTNAAVRDAAASGRVRIENSGVVVNYPFVRWPGGELPRDARREAYLGEGQLLERPNVEQRQVTFKLHQCFPGEWYIVTDTSATPMAPMMRIAASPKTQGLTAARVTANILVFGNGIKGPGPMGFQPSIVDSLPGNPVWSPFWDHYTFTWVDGRAPLVVRNQSDLQDLEAAGGLKRWPGTPDTKGRLFVVNCPVAVTAPMTWPA
ncbi:MAG: DUF7482 domain-containing protein [bacterium]